MNDIDVKTAFNATASTFLTYEAAKWVFDAAKYKLVGQGQVRDYYTKLVWEHQGNPFNNPGQAKYFTEVGTDVLKSNAKLYNRVLAIAVPALVIFASIALGAWQKITQNNS